MPPAPLSSNLYAALDLGTNNCRMLIARPRGVGFRVIDAFSRVTRLGEGLALSGVLAETAMQRTLAALGDCRDKMDRHGVTHVRLVATEACRRAANHQDFVARVRQQTGIALDIISAQEEAALALAGCAPLLRSGRPDALVFDIGGGSTELIWVHYQQGRPEIRGITSLPVGVVTLAEETRGDVHSRQGYDAAVHSIMNRLRDFDAQHGVSRAIARGSAQMLGTSGTVTTLAALALGLERYDRGRVDGVELNRAQIAQVTRQLHAMTEGERAKHPCVGPERADLVVAGCAILEALCQAWPLQMVRVADRGVREGLLLSMMRDGEAR